MTALPDTMTQFQAHERRTAQREPVEMAEGPGVLAGRVAMAGTAMAIPKNARSRSSPVSWNISQPRVKLSNIWCPVTPARRPNQ